LCPSPDKSSGDPGAAAMAICTDHDIGKTIRGSYTNALANHHLDKEGNIKVFN
jgi:hypothetical protein